MVRVHQRKEIVSSVMAPQHEAVSNSTSLLSDVKFVPRSLNKHNHTSQMNIVPHHLHFLFNL